MTESDLYAIILIGIPCGIALYCIAIWCVIFTCCETIKAIKGIFK